MMPLVTHSIGIPRDKSCDAEPVVDRFLWLPHEIVWHIFSYLPRNDIPPLRTLAKGIKQIIDMPNDLNIVAYLNDSNSLQVQDAFPNIKKVKLLESTPNVKKSLQKLKGLREIHLSNPVPFADVVLSLVSFRNLRKVKIHLYSHSATHVNIEALASLNNSCEVHVDIGLASFYSILSSKNINQIKTLKLRFSFDNRVEELISDIVTLTALRKLCLRAVYLSKSQIEKLTLLSELQELRMFFSSPYPKSILSSIKKFKKLHSLHLSYCILDEDDDACIATMSQLTSLLILEKSSSEQDQKLQTICKMTSLRQLNYEVCQSDVSDFGLAQLSNLKKLQKLTITFQSWCPHDITGIGFASVSHMPDLKKLRLWEVPFTVEAAHALRLLQGFETLALLKCEISPEASAAIANLTSLKCLKISCTKISVELIEALESLPLLGRISLHSHASLSKDILNRIIKIKHLHFLSLHSYAICQEWVVFLKDNYNMEMDDGDSPKYFSFYSHHLESLRKDNRNGPLQIIKKDCRK